MKPVHSPLPSHDFFLFEDLSLSSNRKTLKHACLLSLVFHVVLILFFLSCDFLSHDKDTPLPKKIRVLSVKLSTKPQSIEKTVALAESSPKKPSKQEPLPQPEKQTQPVPKEEVPPSEPVPTHDKPKKEEVKPPPKEEEKKETQKEPEPVTVSASSEIRAPIVEKKTTVVPSKKTPSPKPTPTKKEQTKPAPSSKKTATKATTQQQGKKEVSTKQAKEEEAKRKANKELANTVQSLIAQAQMQRKGAGSTQGGNSKESSTPCPKVATLSFEGNAEESDGGSQEATPEEIYVSNLIRLIQLSLTIPEKEAVSLKLTITRSGMLKTLSIMSSKSQRNKQVVEKGLSSLRYPAFGTAFSHDKEHTFSLRLTREMEWMSL